MKIAIISHTEHYIDPNLGYVGWGPTIKEINNLLDIVDEVMHIAPLYNTAPPKSSLAYISDKISLIPLKPSGGRGLSKISLLFKAPQNLYTIHKSIKEADYVQFRAPTGMGIYVLPYLKYFNKNKYWIKYAGNWVDNNMPLGNKLQKFWIKNFLNKNVKVTLNGEWEKNSNFLPFENPCLDEFDRDTGKIVSQLKTNHNQKINYCFVGALNKFKGVALILESFASIESEKIGKVHFVGDGKEMESFVDFAKNISHDIIFHGFLSKDSIRDVYNKSHFIILPSRSEGFPKVIAEGMNYGCIPIVSNVSCLDQYVENDKNGYLLNEINVDSLTLAIKNSLDMSSENYTNWLVTNYELAKKFTFNYYNKRLKSEIFK